MDKENNYETSREKPLDLLSYIVLLGFKNSFTILFFSITISLPLMQIHSQGVESKFPQKPEFQQGIGIGDSQENTASQSANHNADISYEQIAQAVSARVAARPSETPPDRRPPPAPSGLQIILKP
jgi:hypothetical protein